MTEPPRPTGEGTPGQPSPDPTSPPPPPAPPFTTPGEASAPGQTPPQYDTPGYAPPGAYPPPGGYPPPPSGPPPGGYGGFQAQGPGYPPPGFPPGAYPPGPGMPPPGYQSSEDKTWALVAHFGGAAGALIGAGVAGWIAPLIALLVRGNQSPAVRAHAVAALNFQLLWTIVGVVGWIFTCIVIGFFGVIAAMLIGVIFGIIAGVKANEGGFYSYPLSFSIIK